MTVRKTDPQKPPANDGEPPRPPVVEISRIASEEMIVPLVGTSPLVVSRFSEKAKRQMLDSQQGRKAPKQVRDPDAEYESALYYHDDGSYGFPVSAFKLATAGAARFYGKDVSMTALRQFIFMRGEMSNRCGQQLVRVDGEPKMREDVVRLGGMSRSADLRYRPEFQEWSVLLRVVYVTSCLSRNSVLSLIDAGGMGIGVGEWRPEHRGEFGCYTIDESREIEIVG